MRDFSPFARKKLSFIIDAPRCAASLVELTMIASRLYLVSALWMATIQSSLGQDSAPTIAPTMDSNITNSSTYYGPDPYDYYKIPPWGLSSFGNVDEFGSNYRGQPAFADVVRSGWSWTQREMRKSAPFCYDTLAGYSSSCYTGSVKEICEESLGGISAYGDRLCLSKKPFGVLGPVCWNLTCYDEETKAACDAVGGYFIGATGPGSLFQAPQYNDEPDNGIVYEAENAAWCAIPGKNHTIVGPACYGKECFTEELAAACKEMGGTNFADRFCLVDESYKVIGPICTPINGPIEEASICHPEETKALCSDMNGINIGDIFCVVKGDYTVLGPFCTAQQKSDTEPDQVYADCVSEIEGETACSKLSGRSIGKGMFCVLPGNDYHLLGPLCQPGGGCWVLNESTSGGNDNCAMDYGGTAVGYASCIIKGDYTIVGPSVYGDVAFSGDNLLADDVTESEVFSPIQGDNSWYVLNGTFSVYGPTCYGPNCFDGDCLKAGGSKINSIFCVIAEEDTAEDTSSHTLSTSLASFALSAALALSFV